jgi:hypothetical protein
VRALANGQGGASSEGAPPRYKCDRQVLFFDAQFFFAMELFLSLFLVPVIFC